MSSEPHFGFTRHGHAVHRATADYHPDGTAWQRFNKSVALGINRCVFTMNTFWAFNLLAFCSLPAVLTGVGIISNGTFPGWLVSASFISLIAWVAQTYLQLVLLPALGVGQSLQSVAADIRAAKTFEDVKAVRSDIKTALWCAYAFALFDLISLPEAIRGGAAALVSWVAQTFLQLVLLSVIMVGQNVQAAAADKRAEATYDDASAALHELAHVQGHLAAQDLVLTRIAEKLGLDPVPVIDPPTADDGPGTEPTPASA